MSADSIANKHGTYGSKYSSESIFNNYLDYGSKYSEFGACNRYANDPPVIVDQEGNYYSRLTMNKFHPRIGIGKKLIDFVTSVCEGEK